jgi:hypothetical protein
MDNATKEKIIDRLHKAAGVCTTCGQRNCPHGGGEGTTLPKMLDTDTVLHAINVGEYFFEEIDK